MLTDAFQDHTKYVGKSVGHKASVMSQALRLRRTYAVDLTGRSIAERCEIFGGRRARYRGRRHRLGLIDTLEPRRRCIDLRNHKPRCLASFACTDPLLSKFLRSSYRPLTEAQHMVSNNCVLAVHHVAIAIEACEREARPWKITTCCQRAVYEIPSPVLTHGYSGENIWSYARLISAGEP